MRSGFFNSEIIGYDAENMPVFDRAEEASFFAKFFNTFISNGVFPNPSTNMQVLADTEMTVKVDIGVCYINGYMGWVETPEKFTIEESDLQARIDRVVARLDFTDRSINLFVKKGTAKGNPVAPELQRDYDIYEIALADIRVNANVIEITQENITDLRLNTEVCGIVANQLQHVDTTTIFNQYLDWLKRIMQRGEKDLERLESELVSSFNEWFKTVEYVLDGDAAGHLLNLIHEKSLKCKTRVLNVNNWVQNEETGYYEYTINNSLITASHLVEGHLDLENQEKLSNNYIESFDGGYKIITEDLPEEDITVNIAIQKADEGGLL